MSVWIGLKYGRLQCLEFLMWQRCKWKTSQEMYDGQNYIVNKFGWRCLMINLLFIILSALWRKNRIYCWFTICLGFSWAINIWKNILINFCFLPLWRFFTEYSTGSKNSRLWGLQKERFWMQLNVTSQILMVQLKWIILLYLYVEYRSSYHIIWVVLWETNVLWINKLN